MGSRDRKHWDTGRQRSGPEEGKHARQHWGQTGTRSEARSPGEIAALFRGHYRHALTRPSLSRSACTALALLEPLIVARLNAIRVGSYGVAKPMIERLAARMLLWGGYRSRSLTINQRQFSDSVNAIEDLIATASDVTLRGRRPIPPLPGIKPVMRSWSAYMTIDHINGVHESMLERIPELEAGRQPDIGDISRFDHPDECGPEVMARFRDLATQIADLPKAYAFTGRGSFVHPIFGRLNSRGAFALLAFHLQLHVPQIRRSVLINAQASE